MHVTQTKIAINAYDALRSKKLPKFPVTISTNNIKNKNIPKTLLQQELLEMR